jgi:hypothetical protein
MKEVRRVLGCAIHIINRDHSSTIEFTFKSPKELLTAPDIINAYLPRGTLRFSSIANKVNVFFSSKDL